MTGLPRRGAVAYPDAVVSPCRNRIRPRPQPSTRWEPLSRICRAAGWALIWDTGRSGVASWSSCAALFLALHTRLRHERAPARPALRDALRGTQRGRPAPDRPKGARCELRRVAFEVRLRAAFRHAAPRSRRPTERADDPPVAAEADASRLLRPVARSRVRDGLRDGCERARRARVALRVDLPGLAPARLRLASACAFVAACRDS